MKLILVIVVAIAVFAVILLFLSLTNKQLPNLVLQDCGSEVYRAPFEQIAGKTYSYKFSEQIFAQITVRDKDFLLTIRDHSEERTLVAQFFRRVMWNRDGKRLYIVKSDHYDRSIAWGGQQVGIETLLQWSLEGGFKELIPRGFISGPHQSSDGQFVAATVRRGASANSIYWLDTRTGVADSLPNPQGLEPVIPINKFEAYSSMFDKPSGRAVVRVNLKSGEVFKLGTLTYVHDMASLPNSGELKLLVEKDGNTVDLMLSNGSFTERH